MSGLRGTRLHLIEDFTDVEDFFRWLSTVKGPLGVDTETGGLDWWRVPLRTIQIGDMQHGWTIPEETWKGVAVDALKRWDGDLVFQNAKFDLHFLESNDVPVARHRVHDTKVAAHLVDNVSPNGLKSLAVRYVDDKANVLEHSLKTAMRQNKWTWATVPTDFGPYWQYAALDPVLTTQVLAELNKELTPHRELYELELGLQLQLVDMERRGITIDVDYCHQAIDALEQEASDINARITAEYGIENPGSNQQIIAQLKKADVPLTEMTEKGNIKLDEEVLKSIDHPLAAAVLQYRHAVKIASTYLSKYVDLADSDGILHASVNQLGAKTGRMSISRPSMQNLERSATVRDAFTARPGRTLLLIDYDQIELRLLAHYAGIESLLEAGRAGVDLHTVTARGIYGIAASDPVPKGKRQLTKNATYCKIYGGGVDKFAETAHVTAAEANAFLMSYDKSYPEVLAFQQAMENHALKSDDPHITTGYGRQLRKPVYKGNYIFVNYLIQGTAADVLKDRMVALSCEGLDQYLVLPVHDELIFDVPDDEVEEYEHAVIEVMEERTRFNVPLTVEATRVQRWGDKYREEIS